MLHSGTWRKLQTLAEGHIDVWSQHNTRGCYWLVRACREVGAAVGGK